jgi:hypothetical protein
VASVSLSSSHWDSCLREATADHFSSKFLIHNNHSHFLLLSRIMVWNLDWWLDLLNTLPHKFGNTSNYSAIAILHTLQMTAADTKPSPASNIFTCRFLVTVLTVEILQLPRSRHSRLATFKHLLTLNWLCPLFITSQNGPRRNTPFPLLQSSCCNIKNLLPNNENVFN